MSNPTNTLALPLKGTKDDAGKDRYDLVPAYAEQEVVRVLTFGAMHYGADNWRQVEAAQTRYLAAARRHIAAWQRGEVSDPHTGLHHLAHAVCSLMFILELEIAVKAKEAGQ